MHCTRQALAVLCLPAVAVFVVWLSLQPILTAQVNAVPATVHAELRAHHQPYVPLARISLAMQHAIIAIEDRRFYGDWGIDPHGIARALWDDLRHGNLQEGGATLTNQLVERTAPLPSTPLLWPFDVVALSLTMARHFSRAQILDLYLNDVYYGRGQYGIWGAAHQYFGTTPARLTIPQAAFLAALPQSPSYDGSHPRSALVQGRWRTVIRDMAHQGFISAAQARVALSHPLRLRS